LPLEEIEKVKVVERRVEEGTLWTCGQAYSRDGACRKVYRCRYSTEQLLGGVAR
jgi:hypothetical protein